MIVSAYLYHLRLGAKRARCGASLCEAWMYQPTSQCRFVSSNDNLGLYHKLTLASEEEGLFCQAQQIFGEIESMVHMCDLVRKHPAEGIQFGIAEWQADFNATLYRMLAACKVRPLLRQATARHAAQRLRMPTGGHINMDRARAALLSALLTNATPASTHGQVRQAKVLKLRQAYLNSCN